MLNALESFTTPGESALCKETWPNLATPENERRIAHSVDSCGWTVFDALVFQRVHFPDEVRSEWNRFVRAETVHTSVMRQCWLKRRRARRGRFSLHLVLEIYGRER